MFPKQTILYISRHKIKAVRVSGGSHPVIEKSQDFEYSAGALTEALLKLKGEFKIHDSLRILLDDSLSYILDLAVPKNIVDEKEYIVDKIKGDIPEVLENPDWDFKEVGGDKTKKRILVFVPVKDFFVKLSRALKEAVLSVEAIEPVSLALRRDSDPIIGLAKKTDIKGKDEEVLNMKPKDVKIEPEDKNDEEDSQAVVVEPTALSEGKSEQHIFDDEPKYEKEEKSSKKWLIIFFLFVILVISAGAAYYFLIVKKASAPLPEKTPTEEAGMVEPTATPAPVNLADYKILIKNGSGVVGQAGVIEEILKEEGFADFETANADNYDYKNTEVSLKENVPDKVFETIDGALKSDYTVRKQEKFLTATEGYDVLIVVGVKNESVKE